MKYITYVIISFALITYNVSAQENETNNQKSGHQIGIHAGISTGTGLSYRYWPNKFGIQVTLLPFFRGRMTRIAGGVTGLYRLKKYEKLDLFMYLGNAFNYSTYFNNTSHSLGLGPGFDITIAKDLGLNLMFGYHIWSHDPLEVEYRSGMTGEIGLYLKL